MSFLFFLFIGFIAFHAATFLLVVIALNSTDFTNFIEKILFQVYTIIALGLVMFLMLPDGAYSVPLFFFSSFLLTWCFVDYKETYKSIREYKDDQQ